MECNNHPDREAVANCSVCGKAVCQECCMEIAGNIYCKDCVNEIVTKSILEKATADSTTAPKQTLAKEPAESRVDGPIDVIEPIEPIIPIQAEEREVEEEIVKPIEKAPENFETDFEYETEYVETYEEDGAEDSYYENPEPIPEPEPEYKEHERKLKEEAIAKKAPIEPIHTEDIDEDYYYEEPIPTKTPSNELEAKYERYLEDLYYDEEDGDDVIPQELLDEVEETPKAQQPRGRKRRRRQRTEPDEYYEGPRRQRPQDYPPEDRGEYYINPREENFDDEYIVPSHTRGRRDAESYEELKRRIERNYEMEQENKKRGRFRRSKKSKPEYDDELENIQEMHRFPDEFEEESGRISITEIILAIILILLIILLILYVIYLFRLNGDYVNFIEALLGLVQSPGEFMFNVLN